MWAVVCDLMALAFKVGHNRILKVESGVIAADMDSHRDIF